MGPCRERLAHTGVELVFVQPALYERDLELLGRLLAVGVGRAEVAAVSAFRGCYLISRPCHHGASPPA
jgi:hypothetical protein